MAGNNNHIVLSAETDTIPRSIAPTGTTISTVNGLDLKVVGVGTSFLTEFQIGDWLFIPSELECRKIINIVSDTELTLEKQFSTRPLTAVAYRKTPKSNFSMISYAFDASGGSVDGVTAQAGQSNTFEQGTKGGVRAQRVDPIVIEATGSCTVTVYQG